MKSNFVDLRSIRSPLVRQFNVFYFFFFLSEEKFQFVTAPRFELTPQRQKVLKLPSKPPGRPAHCIESISYSLAQMEKWETFIYVLPNPSRETKFSGANGDREKLIFPVQLTTSRIGNLTQLIHILRYVMAIHHGSMVVLMVVPSYSADHEQDRRTIHG